MKQIIRLAYYNKSEWNYLLDIIDDRCSLPESWEAWFESHKNMKRDIVAGGNKVREIKIIVDELIEYCELRQLKIDTKAINQFVKNY
ncbi:MAG TPA: hypothetical protein PLP11_02590 [Bacteroidales bacterium]|nr:hypothetical protein [Bacteroidales bacterium]